MAKVLCYSGKVDEKYQRQDFLNLVDTARENWNQIEKYIWRWYPVLQNRAFAPI